LFLKGILFLVFGLRTTVTMVCSSLLCFQEVADLIGADPKEIIFTSGATESNNIAVKGVARFYASKKRHVITTQTV